MLRVLAQGLPELIQCTPRLAELVEAKLSELVSNSRGITDALVDLPFVEGRQVVPLAGAAIKPFEPLVCERVLVFAECLVERFDGRLGIVELALIDVRLTNQQVRSLFAILGKLELAPQELHQLSRSPDVFDECQQGIERRTIVGLLLEDALVLRPREVHVLQSLPSDTRGPHAHLGPQFRIQ